jgi:hypothetical protein
MKRAGIELERRFGRGPFSRLELGGAVQRQTNPAFQQDDDRQRVWARVERAEGPLRAGGTVGWQRVSFAGIEDRFHTVGGDLTLDTRLDPVVPRNAIYAVASWERLGAPASEAINRGRLEARRLSDSSAPWCCGPRRARRCGSAPAAVLKSMLAAGPTCAGFARDRSSATRWSPNRPSCVCRSAPRFESPGLGLAFSRMPAWSTTMAALRRPTRPSELRRRRLDGGDCLSSRGVGGARPQGGDPGQLWRWNLILSDL